jgi:agmatinase
MGNHRSTYNPSGIGQTNGNLFGLPVDYDSARLIVLAVPWEVTVSYGAGTARGPQRILEASSQLDLYDRDHPEGWEQGIFMPTIPADILNKSDHYRQQASQIIARLEQGQSLTESPDLTPVLAAINQASESINQWLFEQCDRAMAMGKRVAVIGGDHSVSLGLFRAQAARHEGFGILHIDAHADLRQAYEGFEYSHASIMFNALKLPQLTKLVQVGLRDICQDEVDLIAASDSRVVAYLEPMMQEELYAGKSWQEICQAIVQQLPPKVHVSFDIDGLDPKLCPATGTPVPGGLDLGQAFFLVREVVRSGRQIIGFDLCEVGNAEWDGNVGARVAYKLANLMDLSLQAS